MHTGAQVKVASCQFHTNACAMCNVLLNFSISLDRIM